MFKKRKSKDKKPDLIDQITAKPSTKIDYKVKKKLKP